MPYTDVPTDVPVAIAMSTLTDEGVIQGNPDGTFRPYALLNRAEFIKIAMGLLPPYGIGGKNCFPDVSVDAWYHDSVCRAKELGIVSGNAVAGVPQNLWLFAPERNVQYVEALKILAGIYQMRTVATTGEWYAPYVIMAEDFGIDLPGSLEPGHLLTRGEMARLVTRFLAFNEGSLDKLKAAEEGRKYVAPATSASSSHSSSSVGLDDGWVVPQSSSAGGLITNAQLSSSSSSSSSAASSTSSFQAAEFDGDEDRSIRRQFLLLGTTGPVIGAATVFSEVQPIIVNDFIVKTTAAINSVEQFLVYDENGGLLGRAYRDPTDTTKKTYKASMSNGSFVLGKGEDFTFYVRPKLKAYSSGGAGGETVAIDTLGVSGDGGYNMKPVSAYASEEYLAFETARSVLSAVTNPDSASDFLIAGTGIRLGSFRFEGARGDGGAQLRVLSFSARLDHTGGVTVSDVRLATDGLPDRLACTLSSSVILCPSIPDTYGSFKSQPRTLTLYGNVAIDGSSQTSSLQVRINEPGTVSIPGDIAWTDGETVFEWVPGDVPVVRSTFFSN